MCHFGVDYRLRIRFLHRVGRVFLGSAFDEVERDLVGEEVLFGRVRGGVGDEGCEEVESEGG